MKIWSAPAQSYNFNRAAFVLSIIIRKMGSLTFTRLQPNRPTFLLQIMRTSRNGKSKWHHVMFGAWLSRIKSDVC